jgi:hypothetical protein
MGVIDIDELKNTRWEEKPVAEIAMRRSDVQIVKMAIPQVVPILKMILRAQLIGPKGHAQDKLAERMFNHYLDGDGSDFILTLDDMKYMNSAAKLFNKNAALIDIRMKDKTTPNPVWAIACGKAKAAGIPQDYTGHLHSVWDNGSISTYTVNYSGEVKPTRQLRRLGEIKTTGSSSCVWEGTVDYFDRFDLDPRWDWSLSNQQGRSWRGERRTRMGYILDVGTEFDMKSPKANVLQYETDSSITFSGSIARG